MGSSELEKKEREKEEKKEKGKEKRKKEKKKKKKGRFVCALGNDKSPSKEACKLTYYDLSVFSYSKLTEPPRRKGKCSLV